MREDAIDVDGIWNGRIVAVTSEWVVNEAPTGRSRLALGEFWRARELIAFFALRDIRVRYKQAFLGVAWAVIQPVIGAVTFTVLFNRLARIDLEEGSFFTFALAGYVVWTYFGTAVSTGSQSVTANAGLLTKVAFSRIAPPTAAMLPGLVDLAIGAALAVVATLIVGDGLSVVGILIGLPLGLIVLLLAAAGPVFFFGALIVRYRDARVLLSLGLQVLLFASPVAYPAELVAEQWRTLYYLNPVAGALGLMRAALTGSALPTAEQLFASIAVALLIAPIGLLYFRRSEREFADII